MTDDTDRQRLALDQRTRRAGEVRAAALAYVRECSRRNDVIDLEVFGHDRWKRDGADKRGVMVDALRDEIARGVAVVDVWRRFEVSGTIARRLVGARSYGDLYRILMAHGMEPGFRPGDIASWVRDGKMSSEEGMSILGIADPADLAALVGAFSAG